MDKGYLTEANNLRDSYNAFVLAASDNSATDVNLQSTVCDSIDSFYESVINEGNIENDFECTKNLIKCKQDLIKEFIKVQLKSNTKECPYCTAPLILIPPGKVHLKETGLKYSTQ